MVFYRLDPSIETGAFWSPRRGPSVANPCPPQISRFLAKGLGKPLCVDEFSKTSFYTRERTRHGQGPQYR
jgi:hypothetical protein